MASDLSLENWNLDKWLKKLGLRGKYRQSFIDNGYDTLDLCAYLNKEDLDAIGVTNKHHRSTLFTQSKKLLELLDKESQLTAIVEVADTKTGSLPGIKNTTHPKTSKPPNLTHPSSSITTTEPLLSDYSEPWNGGSSDAVPVSPTVKSPLHKLKVGNGTSNETTDGLPPHRGVQLAPNSVVSQRSPGTDLPAYTKTTTTGLTRLQLKLKIREELFSKGVVLSEYPYCKEDGSPDEQLVIDLAAELASRFEIGSLEMYNTLQEVWSNANETSYATAKLNKTVKFEKKGKDVKKLPELHVQSTLSNTDNYDEPFDSASGFTPRLSPIKKKSSTLPSQSSDGCYDEPFDSVSKGKASPEKAKRNSRFESSSQTLPSPRRQRKSIEITTGEGSHSPKTPPRGSPGRSSSNKSRFNIFKRKEKSRSQSVREYDLKLFEDENNLGKKQAVISFPQGAKHVSAENISEMGISPNSLQMEYLKNRIPPPLPSPRQKKVTDDLPEEVPGSSRGQFNKKHEGNKFMTPPTLQRNQKPQFDYISTSSSSNSSENDTPQLNRTKISSKSTAEIDRILNSSDEYGEKAWLQTSKSYNELRDTNIKQETTKTRSHSKKGKTSRFISRLFKRKSMTPATIKKEKSKTLNRGSIVSNISSVDESRERCLTGSISMPDISKVHDIRSHITSADHHDIGYTEIFDDAIKPGDAYPGTDPLKKNERSFQRMVPHKQPRSTLNRGGEATHVTPSHPSPPVTMSHRQMRIRGVSDSSAPDHTTISIKSGGSSMEGSEFTENAESSTLVSTDKPVDSISAISDELTSSNSEDLLSNSSTSTGYGVGGSAGRSQGFNIGSRSGSTGSNTSSELLASSVTKKPPTLPKPHSLIKSSLAFSSPSHTQKSGTMPSKSNTAFSSLIRNNATPTMTSKPPPKPTRSPSRKSPTSTSAPSSPPNQEMVENQTNLSVNKSGSMGPKPPPKPLRLLENNMKNGTITSPPPPASVVVVGEDRKPPPKPSRRGRSEKLSKTLERPSLSSTTVRSASTLPHQFKMDAESKPVPKPRNIAGFNIS